MKIRNAVKEKNPDCKIVFIVDENAEKELAKQVRQAKKDGLIDQFIYGSISATYLADIVDAL
jgi:N12 class adenine-specific DNA methylase